MFLMDCVPTSVQYKQINVNAKLKVNVKVQFTLEQTTKSQRGRKGIVMFFLNLGARLGRVVWAMPRSLYPRERESVPIV
jgi:hypothetical protein